jgi:chemotaxis protein histidine kinase CheA
VNFGKSIKAAFLYHWNLLAFLGGMGFAALTGHPDVFCPLVVAGEVAYLGVLGTHPKFRKYIESLGAQDERQKRQAGAEQNAQRILRTLPEALVKRFQDLRSRCLELRQIALELKEPGPFGSPPPLEDLQLAGLDRLLWIYLRLLFTQHMLERFFQKTSEAQILEDIRTLEQRIKRTTQGPDDPQKQKVRKSLEDNLETCRARLANFQKARDNDELVKVEIERLENKIRSLSELAINREEPDFISGQVDQVVGSMVQTERTMNELRFATGLEVVDEEIPAILRPSPEGPSRPPRGREGEIKFLDDEVQFL